MSTTAATADLAHIRTRTADPRRTLWVSAAGTLLVLAVFSAVVTSVGASTSALGGGVSDETWTLSGMSLGLAVALLTVGTLADDLGRRKLLVISGVLLTATSVLAALAPTADVLIAARILQGISGAGVVTASLGAIGHAFSGGRQRTFATSVWGAALGAGIAIGPLASGALSDALGWRSSYWLQAIGAALLVPAALTIDESRSQNRRPLDLWGAAALAVAMACLTAGLIEGRNSWSSPSTIVLLAGGVALLAVFAAIEARRRHPMLELSRFTQPLFIASLSGALTTGLAVIGLMSVTPLVLQLALHVSVLGSAAVLAAWSATSMAVALATRPVLGRLDSPSVLALGFSVCAVGEFVLVAPRRRLVVDAAAPGSGDHRDRERSRELGARSSRSRVGPA